jgi:mannosylglycerate hydrolase
MIGTMDCVLVSHTHWDREWYRSFQEFRARLVDAVDVVLDQLDRDPGWSFVLDGQTIVVEDYLAVRPHQGERLAAAVRSGRLTIGPWYVQPDSLLPGGESHVRNLLEGRRVGEQFGPVSRVAYTPDSFGHPAQFPQIFSGFGLDGFVYWRGNGDEIESLPPVYRWEAPDGTAIIACHLTKGYFAAANLPDDPAAAVIRLRGAGMAMIAAGATELLLLNGIDHAPPDSNTEVVAAALAAETGWKVIRGCLEDYTNRAIASARPAEMFSGELVGGYMTNLLPGVWSSRLELKIRNRRAETALVGWAEPWAALGAALGLCDERPALRIAWRALLTNQAHDSIGGCSQDRVHRQMLGRYDQAEELASETTARILSRLAGLAPDRTVAWSDELDVAVFNPSPHPRTDVVRFPLDAHPFSAFVGDDQSVHPLALASALGGGITVDGVPARVVVDDSPDRVRVIPEQQPWTVEWIATDIPGFGWRRFHLGRGRSAPDQVDDGRAIGADAIDVRVVDDGTLNVTVAGCRYEGQGRIEDTGDRGDTYDFDPVPGDIQLSHVAVTRRRHSSGIQELDIIRTFDVPESLTSQRAERSASTVDLSVRMRAWVIPGVPRVDLEVIVNNTALDHRLRLAFPSGGPGEGASAATTLDVAPRAPRPQPATTWFQPSPRTFPHQGWVHNNGLTVVAPGLPEAEVTEDGTIFITMVRAVGWLSRLDLRSRPEPAGPGLRTPEAQCIGEIRGRLALTFGSHPQVEAWDAELGLRAVPAGPEPILSADQGLVSLDAPGVVLSALKPAEDGNGLVARLLNPTAEPIGGRLQWGDFGGEVSEVRLDEEPAEPTDPSSLHVDGNTALLDLPSHHLRSLRIGAIEGGRQFL